MRYVPSEGIYMGQQLRVVENTRHIKSLLYIKAKQKQATFN